MRKIYISDAIVMDERLLALSSRPDGRSACLLWPYFLLTLDDWGRGSANPAILKARGAPAWDCVTREDFAAATEAYADVGLIMLYEVDGSRYAAIPPETWWRYQTHIRAEKREVDGSKFPSPQSESAVAIDCAQLRANARDSVQSCASPSPSPSPSSKATPSRRSASPTTQVVVSTHPNAPYMEVFASAFGDARTPAETKRRAIAANQLRAGEVQIEEVRQAIARWPDIFPGATCTPHAIANNITTLMHAVGRKPQGQVDATRAWLAMGSGDDTRATGGRPESPVGRLPPVVDRGGPDDGATGVVGAGRALRVVG